MLVAYDGSVAARRAIVHAVRYAATGDEVTVINVRHEPSVGAQITPPVHDRNRQRQLLEDARRFLAGEGIECDVAAPVGDPAAEILAAAERLEADVIVIGRRRGKTPHLGSISGRVVRAADCDVLVVHGAPADRT